MTWQLQQFLQGGAVAVLEALGDAISIQDVDLKVLYQNPRHIQLMGDQKGRFCYEAYQKRDTVCPGCHLLTSFSEGRTNRRVTSMNHPQRGVVHVEIISSPIMDESGVVVAGVEAVRDITERRLMDDKLNAITCDLEQKTWKLMAANRELESFSYTLSHDMNNYLAKIAMSADALTSVASDNLDDAGRFLLGSISESCAALSEMIEAILRLSFTGRSGVNQDEVDLGHLAEEVAMELKCQYPDHPVEFETGTGLRAMGDRQLLKIMLRNLLGNAWKYTQGIPGARVSFTAEDHDGKIIHVVRDNGPGFDMKEAGRLFKPFSRLSGSEMVKGSGIGLATVRKIVLCHGGEIWGEGTPGKGAAFYFALPTPG